MIRADPEPTAVLSVEDVRWLRSRVRAWFVGAGRTFPWREARDPYEVLIAELLLQRTRADLVPATFAAFLRRYPNVEELAKANHDDVVEILRPLGFVHRSARLPAMARELRARFGGAVPSTEEELMSLPGVGRYVANAVLVVAFGLSRPLLDPNVVRVLDRCFRVTSGRSRPREDERLWELVATIVPSRDPRSVALGLIDLGAVICRRGRPRCGDCPLRVRCLGFSEGLVSAAD